MNTVLHHIMIAAAILMPVLCSCSIFEDREDCPVTIHFDEKRVNPWDCDGRVTVTAFKHSIEKQVDTTMEAVMNGFTIRIQKGTSTVTGFAGVEDMTIHNGELRIPLGKDCDPIFSGSESFTTYAEDYTVTTPLCKQHAKLTIHNVAHAGIPGIRFYISGNNCGYDMYTREPVRGDFLCEAVRNYDADDEQYVCNLPRQDTDNMRLWIYVGDEKRYDVNLGAYLALGYDWNKKDLDDIDLMDGFVNAKLFVRVRDWEIVWQVDFNI